LGQCLLASSQMVDCWMEAWYMRVYIGAISVLHIFKKLAGILSGPGALEMSNSFSRLKTPSTSIERVVISGKGESWIDGSVSDELCVKTEVK